VRPGLSFSKALFIVLGLHLLAIGGFFAFGAAKSVKGPQYAGVSKPHENVQEQDKKWLKDHPVDQPARSPAKVAKADPVKSREGANPKKTADTQRVVSGESKPRAVVAHPAGVAKKPPVVQKKDEPVAQPESDAEAPPWLEKAKSMLAAGHPPKVSEETQVETRRAVAVNEPDNVPLAPNVSAPDEVSLPGGDYTLAAGDNLYSVARKLHVSYQEIAEANGIKDARGLQVGQKLKVPARKITSR